MITVDDVVKMAISDLYPGHTVPDANNFREDGTRFKAPDFGLFGEKILIELKSRNAKDQSQFYDLVQKIASEQGAGLVAYGEGDIQRLVRLLPDPVSANKRLIYFCYGQSRKMAREARRKFEDYEKHRPRPGAIRVLIVSDNTEITATNDAEEAFFGEKMGARDVRNDDLGMIDAVMLIKDPRRVIDRENSYWFKCLLRQRVTGAGHAALIGVVESLRLRISNYAPYVGAIESVRLGEFRILVV